MPPHSFQSSFQRKRPALDVVSPLPVRVPLLVPPAVVRVPETGRSHKHLDGIRKEKYSFWLAFKEYAPRDAMRLALRRTQIYWRRSRRLFLRLVPDMAPQKMLYVSIASGIAFGMVSMVFISHVFGTGVLAREESEGGAITAAPLSAQKIEAGEVTNMDYDPDQDIFFEYFDEATQEQYEQNIRQMVQGYPIEAMLPYIFAQDRLTAAFLIGIGKKESNWGKRVPVLAGQDCFNYWGYRGVRRMMGTGGHTCFNSRKDAVETVAHRLNTLIQSQKLNTPEKLIVWKCGFSCEGHSRESVKKWISDVDMYYEQLKDE